MPPYYVQGTFALVTRVMGLDAMLCDPLIADGTKVRTIAPAANGSHSPQESDPCYPADDPHHI